jgi:hypothetical protein
LGSDTTGFKRGVAPFEGTQSPFYVNVKESKCNVDAQGIIEKSKFLFMEQLIADSLYCFSMDLVRVVKSYLCWPQPKNHTKPKLLQSLKPGEPPYACYGIACSPDREIWVAAHAHVLVYNYEGQYLRSLGYGTFLDVCGIAFLDNGYAYITDYDRGCVFVYQSNGTMVQNFYLEENHIWYAASGNGLLFVTIHYNGGKIQAFTADGVLTKTWIAFNGPIGIAVNDDHEVGVVNADGKNIEVCYLYYLF